MSFKYVNVNIGGFKQFTKDVHLALRWPSMPGPIGEALDLWGVIYCTFLQRRFLQQSRGGGEWPPLKESTLRRRRGGPTNKWKQLVAAKKKHRKLKSEVDKRIFSGRGTEKQFDNLVKRERKAFKAVKDKKAAWAKVVAGGKGSGVMILQNTRTLFNALDPSMTRAPGRRQERVPFGIRVGYGGPNKHPSGKATIYDIAHFHQTGGGHLPQRRIIVPPDEETRQRMFTVMSAAIRKMHPKNK